MIKLGDDYCEPNPDYSAHHYSYYDALLDSYDNGNFSQVRDILSELCIDSLLILLLNQDSNTLLEMVKTEIKGRIKGNE